MIDWLNSNAGAVTAAATTVYAVITLLLLFEARRARQLQGEAVPHRIAAAAKMDKAYKAYGTATMEVLAVGQISARLARDPVPVPGPEGHDHVMRKLREWLKAHRV